ncbi:MAG: hypothetical protein BZY87_07870 [SAR202 cluster bacterium Io17-Chloro-G6]|nr:MAG: hypothetical protein BZY87_07870 [SAR202 cluster bacterium Io17-Chloro-G6]
MRNIKSLYLYIGLVALILFGCSSQSPEDILPTQTGGGISVPIPTEAPANGSGNSDGLILNDPAELNFDIGDFPLGWQIKAQRYVGFGGRDMIFTPERGDTHWLTLTKTGDRPSEINSSISVAPDIESATAGFDWSLRNASETTSVREIDIGSEAYVHAQNNAFSVTFRMNNITASVSMRSESEYQGSIEATEEWARKLASGIEEQRTNVQPVHLAEHANFSASDLPEEWTFNRSRISSNQSVLEATGPSGPGSSSSYMISQVFAFDDEDAAAKKYSSLLIPLSPSDWQTMTSPPWIGADSTMVSRQIPNQPETIIGAHVFLGRKGQSVVHIQIQWPRSRQQIDNLVMLISAKLAR